MVKKLKYCHNPEADAYSFAFDHVRIRWNEQVTLHQQKTWELSWVIAGSGRRMIGDLVEPFYPGEVILIPPDIPHCWSFDEFGAGADGQIENITVVFTTEFLDNCIRFFPELRESAGRISQYTDAISFEDPVLTQLQQLLLSMTTETRLEQLSTLFRIFSHISLSGSGHTVGRRVIEDKNTARLQKVQLYVLNNAHKEITLAQIAAVAGLDKSSFCVFFKKNTGQSFFSFLTNYRIESSCQMLTKTNLSVAEICFASGFRDVPYYNRVFKKIKGVTPTNYRKESD